MIVGDNGNVYRLVATLPATSFLSYAYDNAYGEQLVVRGVMFLDYASAVRTTHRTRMTSPAARCRAGTRVSASREALPTGPRSSTGAARRDPRRGGDDQIYGMCGNDVIFGDGQDDDIVGGCGNDWISGGTGDDGVLGDDGRIFTSRNGSSPSRSTASLPRRLKVTITTPGKVQVAIDQRDRPAQEHGRT